MSRSLMRGMLCALLSLVPLAAIADPAGPTLLDKLHADVAAKTLTQDDAVVLETLALTAPELFPADYLTGVAPQDGHCATALALDLAVLADKSHPEVREFVGYMSSAPHRRKNMKTPALKSVKLKHKTLAQAAVASAAAASTAPKLLTTPHFLIDYTASNLSYAQKVQAALETSWSSEIDAHGFNAPDAPFNNQLDVIIVSEPALCVFGFPTCGVYGVAMPKILSVAGGGDGDPLIRIRTNMTDGLVQVTSAHEFFHLVQYEMAGFLNVIGEAWYREGMASAMEDVVFPAVNDYVGYVNSFFNNYTDHSLTQIDYPAAIFFKFLMQKYDAGQTDILKLTLVSTAIQGSALTGVYQTLNTYGVDRDEAMHDFALWNTFTGTRWQGGYYDSDAQSFPGIHVYYGGHSLGAVKTVPATDVILSGLSSRYVRITPDSTVTSPRKLTVKVHGDSSGHIRAWLVIRTGGSFSIRDLNLSGSTGATETVNDFSTTTTPEVLLILSNGFEGDELHADYSVELPTSIDLAFCMDTTGSMSGSINALKSTATSAMQTLGSNGADFRIAITEYKDFPVSPYGGFGDFPYRADSPFSNQPATILSGVNMLAASGGGDTPEAQYSGIMGAINAQGIGAWRSGSNKAIIVMTDAAPHNPEPFTGYTAASVAAAAQAGGIVVNNSRGGMTTSSVLATNADSDPIRIYGVVIGGDFSALTALTQLTNATGGKVFTASYNSTDIAAALLAALGEISGGGTTPPPTGNHAPDVSGAIADPATIWSPDNKMVDVHVSNVHDPDGDPVTISITGITQDEPAEQNDQGNGAHSIDGAGVGTSTAQVRAARDGNGNGRVYRITFTATDRLGASSTGSVTVCVPHDQGGNTMCSDDGQFYDSTAP